MTASRAAFQCFVLAGALLVAGCQRPAALEALTGVAQGTTYTVQWRRNARADRDAVASAVTAELDRIDALLSNYRPDSVLERFNRTRTSDVQALPKELVGLLRLARDIHAASLGCFDPTVLPLVRLWGFDGDAPHVPPAPEVAATLERVGFDKLRLIDSEHVQKTVPGLEIDMSSIGQGYAVERLGEVLEHLGIRDYLVEIGGEIVASGEKPNGEGWKIGIEEPLKDREVVAESLHVPRGSKTAVVTSGTYRHYFQDHGRMFSHIIDPHTGEPVRHGPLAVTVVHASATLAAAWGTALTCLGPDSGATVAEQHGIAAIISHQVGNKIDERRTPSLERQWPGALR